jgi:hypothetical protein
MISSARGEGQQNDGSYRYESAMENSKLPVTQQFSQRMMALADGPPTFYNLEVIEDVGS